MIKNPFRFDKSLFKVTSSVGTLSLFSLVFPMIFELVMNNLQGTVNTAILSNYSENAAAAVGAANTIISVVTLIGTVIAMGATVVISNCFGADDLKKAREVSFTSIVVCVTTALVITPLLILFSTDIMTMLNLKGDILKDGLTYFNIRMAFIVFTMATSSVLALLKCYGFAKYTFYIGLLTNIINLVLNIYVIHFPSYAPVTGVAGVAFGCCISNLAGMVAAIFILKRMKIKLVMPSSIKVFWSHISGILKIGLPAGLSNMSFTFSQMLTTAFVALIGDYALSAKVYYANILSYVYLFSVSAGNANALLVGRCYGAGEFDRADKMNRQLVKLTCTVNLVVSLSVVVLRRQLLGLFTDDGLIISLSLGVFAIDIITEQARAISQVYEYALRAAGDILFSTIILIISCWVCSIGLAYFLAIECGMGVSGLWIGLAVDETVRAIVTYLRWKSGKWKKEL